MRMAIDEVTRAAIVTRHSSSQSIRTIVVDRCPTRMSKLLRGLVAGWGASKLGGGCLSTVIIFALLWWLLGTCGVFQ